GVAQLAKGLLAEVGGPVRQGRGVEELADLPAKGAILGAVEPAPQSLAGQGDLEGAPGAVAGLRQRLDQGLTVVDEPSSRQGDEGSGIGVHVRQANSLQPAVDQFAQRQRRQGLEDHPRSSSGWMGSTEPEVSPLFTRSGEGCDTLNGICRRLDRV